MPRFEAGKVIGENGLFAGLQAASTNPLQDSEENQHPQAGRQSGHRKLLQ